MTCECGKDPCCCASITGIKGGIHPDVIKTIHMDLTLEEADASQTITHISKVLLNEPCHIVGFDAALVTVKRDIDQANAAKQIQQGVDAGSDYAIRANTPVNVALYTIPSWSPGDLKKGGFGAISQEQDRYYISTASLSAQSPHWTAHEDLFGYFADGSLFVEYNSPSDQYGVRIVVRYVPRLQFSPAYCDPIETMQHYWKCCHGDKEFLEGFYGGTLLAIPSVSSFSAASAGDSPPVTSYAPSDNPTIGTQFDYSFFEPPPASSVAPSNLLLDDYPGATLAFSVRKLDKDYDGPCMRVRRSDDNAEADIYFDANGDLDETAISNHCRGNTGFVAKWYDQSGNNNHAYQTNTIYQPPIFDGTSVYKQNGKAVVNFYSQKFLPIPSQTMSTDGADTFLVGGTGDALVGATSAYMMVTGSYWAVSAGLAANGNTGGTVLSHTVSAYYINGSVITSPNQDKLHDGMARQGLCRIVQHASTDPTPRTYRLNQVDIAAYSAIQIQEMVTYHSDQSTNASNIETDINGHFSIY